MKIVITTLEGLEEALFQELQDLNLSNIDMKKRTAVCEGSWSHVYRCNYLLRTAIRVLVPIKECTVNSDDALYEASYSINWSNFIKSEHTIAIKPVVSGDIFMNSRYAMYKVKDGIMDNLKDNESFRPKIDPENPDVLINVHIKDDQLTISLDSSGRSLHFRNYKVRSYGAPLNEVLAAGIIKLSKWDHKTTFVDPMCGSGTFITEALMIAANLPAGYFIEKFGFEKWPEFYPDIWKMVKETADANIQTPECQFQASDLNAYAVRDLKKNLQKLPFKEKVRMFQRDFFQLPPTEGAILMMNPPYDSRIKVDNIHEFYKRIGDALKQYWQGSNAWIFTNRTDAMKSFGLHASKRHTLDNGGKESKLYKFEMYGGSKKAKYNKQNDGTEKSDNA